MASFVIIAFLSALAAVITIETGNPYLLLGLLFSFAVVVFATTGVNAILFLVPFIIILLNIYHPNEWYLSFIRILEVTIGGAIEVAMVYLSGSQLTFSHLSYMALQDVRLTTVYFDIPLMGP